MGEHRDDASLPPSKKPKRLKIKVGAANPYAQRMVFDDEGNVRNPLELLAMEDRGEGDKECRGAALGLEGDGLDAGVHDRSSTRMQRVAEIMKKRDEEDRRNEKCDTFDPALCVSAFIFTS